MSYLTYILDLDGKLQVKLQGSWSLANLDFIEKDIIRLDNSKFTDLKRIDIDMSLVDHLDVSGAVGVAQVLNCFAHNFENSDYYKLLNVSNRHLLILRNTLSHVSNPLPIAVSSPIFANILSWLRAFFVDLWFLIGFFGEFCTNFVKNLSKPHLFPYRLLFKQLDDSGARAVPIICVVSLLMGTILTQQIIVQLSDYGASEFVIRGVAMIILRDLAVLLVGITLAGRTVSAFTAEIGLMKVREEIDAMRVMSLQPFTLLVMPRVLGLILVMPMLTIIANFVGLVASAVVCNIVLGFSYTYFFETLVNDVSLSTFFVGLAKAPFMGLWMAIIGCLHGFKVRADSESLGHNTTKAVVKSILAILIIDAVFAIVSSFSIQI